jgi:hypothetical protein
MSEEEWLKIKDLAPLRGSGAPGGGREVEGALARPVTVRSLPDDPSSPAYQKEYKASIRYADACSQLRVRLEAGDLEAAILDPWEGTLHPAPASLWRRHDAARMIDKGQAPIPRTPDTGRLLVKLFAENSVPAKPMPRARIPDAIKALMAETATKTLTREQQKEFVRQSFPDYRVTERDLRAIFKAVEVRPGRPKKSDKKL